MIGNKKDFSALVDLAMLNPGLARMRPVVEKELLHYEIFRALDADKLLKDLVFQGGTSLRLCRGSARYSEDLDFAGGNNFSAERLSSIKDCLAEHIGQIYELDIDVKNKTPKVGADRTAQVRVEKWWISIQSAPKSRWMPRQKIKLEIANVPAHTRQLVPIQDNYGILGPTVMVNAETLAEVMADKILAFPTSLLDSKGLPVQPSSGKIRYRDIWDLAWMSTQRAGLIADLVITKIADYGVQNFPDLLDQAIVQLDPIVKSREFKSQMTRFIDSATLRTTLNDDAYLDYLATSVGSLFSQMRSALNQQ